MGEGFADLRDSDGRADGTLRGPFNFFGAENGAAVQDESVDRCGSDPIRCRGGGATVGEGGRGRALSEQE